MKIRSILIILLLLDLGTSCALKDNKASHLSRFQFTNALINEDSPYLLEHAHNPVNWFPWGKEALTKARKENKPLIISIGYSSCHWCHVMEQESYSDTAVANYMNKYFVSIKIDREERPDIDQIYMDAAMMINGNGGWPLNVFTLPDGRPFAAVTYLPKGGWLDVLKQVVELYQNNLEAVHRQADNITQHLKTNQLLVVPSDSLIMKIKTIYSKLSQGVEQIIDKKEGGFISQTKFPLPVAWSWLLQDQYLTGNKSELKAIQLTLTKMAYGGIYDQLGGGFARYSTDSYWKVPHFEKMLYDNAQLVSLYANAYKVTPLPIYKEIIQQTLQFIQSELTDENGGFYSSINADSEKEEGKYYVWTTNQIDTVLSPKVASLIKDYYHITHSGNWEKGKNTLYRTQDNATFAKEHHIRLEDWVKILRDARKQLILVRNKRVRPSTDNKILTSWNALTIKAYLDAYLALGEKDYLKTALKNATFIENNLLKKDGKVFRNYMNYRATVEGMLDDYANLASAFIQLYQVTYNIHYLEKARQITQYAITHFKDQQTGLFYYTSNESDIQLIVRKMEIEGGVLPSSNSVMASNLYTLSYYYDHQEYLQDAKMMVGNILPTIQEAPIYFANWSRLIGIMQNGPLEIAIMGENSLDKNLELQRNYLPSSIFLGGREEDLPLLQYKLKKGETVIYVCKDKICKTPVTKINEALKIIEANQNKKVIK